MPENRERLDEEKEKSGTYDNTKKGKANKKTGISHMGKGIGIL